MSDSPLTEDELTPTSVFVCSPVPMDPGCINYEPDPYTEGSPVTTIVQDPTTTLTPTTETVALPDSVPRTELPHTGPEDMLLGGIGALLLIIGVVLVRLGRWGR